MSTVGSWLATYRAPLPGATPAAQRKLDLAVHGDRFRADLASIACATAGAGWLVSLVRAEVAGLPEIDAQVHPDDVLAVLARFGIGADSPLSTVNALAQVPADAAAYWRSRGVVELIRFPAMRQVSGDQFLAVMHAQLICAAELDATRYYLDTRYHLSNRAELDELQAVSQTRRYAWLEQRRDCDDHDRIERGWLSQLGYGNLARARLHIYCLTADGRRVAAHVIQAHGLDDGAGGIELVLLEPANGREVPRDYVPETVPTATHHEVFRVEL
jgi:hypothetical protein